ncbi:muscarinic acetylcholine receptor M4-like [Ptychodera flava]|uniref:muscarinic acetylcholine receptor M4-like n=1 Tax=Ptychodera flava TaxID=63121 RepID=UPI00396A7CF4
MEGDSYKDNREIVILLFTVLFSSFCILTIVSNLTILVAFCKTKKLRKPTNYFYISLAVSDCLLGICTLPLAVYDWYQDGYWQLGKAVCILWLAVDYFLITSSVYNIAAICLDRYLALFHALWYRRVRTNSFVIKLIATAWILGFVIEVPAITLWEFIAGNSTINYDEYCNVEYEDQFVFTTIIYLISPTFPCAFIIAIYLRISVMISTRMKRSQEGRNSHSANKTHNLGDGNVTVTVSAKSGACIDTSDAKRFNDSGRPSCTRTAPIDRDVRVAKPAIPGENVYDSFPSFIRGKICLQETDYCNAPGDRFPVRGKLEKDDFKPYKTESTQGKMNNLFELEEIAPREPDGGSGVAKSVDKQISTESVIASVSDIDLQSTDQKTHVIISKSYKSKKNSRSLSSTSENKAAALFCMVVASFLVCYLPLVVISITSASCGSLGLPRLQWGSTSARPRGRK